MSGTSAGLSAAGIPAASPMRSGRNPVVSNAILGMLLFVTTEVMFFMALIGAYRVIRANSGTLWVPPDNVRLPVATTAFNTLILMVSGGLMLLAWYRAAKGAARDTVQKLVVAALAFGAVFVAVQGYEWTRLAGVGLTMLSGIFGATFFLLIGTHGLHAVSALPAMAWLARSLSRDNAATADRVGAVALYWTFVVGIWPVLYALVYFR